ncbi:hypothetical protein ACFLSQ_10895 [Bacteroidota bacterium]
MKLFKKDIINKLRDYLKHNISQNELVDWAENAIMESEFDEKDYQIIRNTLARLGVSDVKEFGLTWEECVSIIRDLGYKIKLELEYA